MIIIFFFFKYFYILVIKYLTPVYAIFLNPIYFFFQKIILGLNTLIREGEFFDKDAKKYLIYKFYFDISGDFVSILGYLIYLEIIELKFCKLDYYTKENIIIRSLNESEDRRTNSTINSLTFDDEEENDDEKNKIELKITDWNSWILLLTYLLYNILFYYISIIKIILIYIFIKSLT